VPPTAPINGQAAPLNANQPGAATTTNSTRREAVTNFEVDKTVRHTRQASGQIRRLTAAVVLNYRTGKPDAKGATQATALSEQEIQSATALVREAMGFSKERGDSLNVVNAQFSTPDIAPVEAVPTWKQPDVIALAKEGGKALLFLLLTLIVVFGVVRPALRNIGARAVVVPNAGEEVPGQAALPAAKPDAGPTVSPLEQMRQLAKNDPATVANVVKAWVGTEQKS
jgi:flagellar M-ring protein FliF